MNKTENARPNRMLTVTEADEKSLTEIFRPKTNAQSASHNHHNISFNFHINDNLDHLCPQNN